MSNIYRKRKHTTNGDIKQLSDQHTAMLLASITDTGELSTVWDVVHSIGYKIVVSGKTLTMHDDCGGSYSVAFGEDIPQQQLRDALRLIIRCCSQQQNFFYTDNEVLKAKVSLLYCDGYIGGQSLHRSDVAWRKTCKQAKAWGSGLLFKTEGDCTSPLSLEMQKAIGIINVLHEGGIGISYQEAKNGSNWTSLRVTIKNSQRFEMVVPVSYNISSVIADQKRLLNNDSFDINFFNAMMLIVRELDANWDYIM